MNTDRGVQIGGGVLLAGAALAGGLYLTGAFDAEPVTGAAPVLFDSVPVPVETVDTDRDGRDPHSTPLASKSTPTRLPEPYGWTEQRGSLPAAEGSGALAPLDLTPHGAESGIPGQRPTPPPDDRPSGHGLAIAFFCLQNPESSACEHR